MTSRAEPPDELGARLRAARERLGLTTRGLARLVGIPAATISAIERGREPRWSTLLRYLESVPGLRASDLLPGPVTHAPVASRGLWASLREAFAQGARSVTVRRGVDSGGRWFDVEVKGVRTEMPCANREETARRLMQLTCIGERELVAGLRPPKGRTLEILHGSVTHRFDVTRTGVLAVDYRRREPVSADGTPAVEQVEHVAGYAVRSLTLAARVPKERVARLLVWPITRRIEGAPAEIASRLYPGAARPRLRRRGDVVTVTIEDVLPGLVHVLDWREDAEGCDEGLVLDEDPETAGFAPIARAVRQRCGLSRRALAEAMGVSHVTVAEAERGRDPSAATLRLYRRALPDVAPQWLLPARPAAGRLTAEERWEALRDLHGLEGARMERRARADLRGDMDYEERLVGVRTLGGIERKVAVSSLHGHDIYARGRYDVRLIETGDMDEDGDVRSRLVHRPHGRPKQEIRIPSILAGRGVSLRTVVHVREHWLMTGAAIRQRYGDTTETIVSGATLVPSLPFRSLLLSVRLPASFPIQSAWPVALPYDRPFDETEIGVLSLAHPGAWFFRRGDEGELVLEVDRPLFGLKYAIGWAVDPSKVP